jgi:hypothetical protein
MEPAKAQNWAVEPKKKKKIFNIKSIASHRCSCHSEVNGFVLPDKDICLDVDAAEWLTAANIDC